MMMYLGVVTSDCKVNRIFQMLIVVINIFIVKRDIRAEFPKFGHISVIAWAFACYVNKVWSP